MKSKKFEPLRIALYVIGFFSLLGLLIWLAYKAPAIPIFCLIITPIIGLFVVDDRALTVPGKQRKEITLWIAGLSFYAAFFVMFNRYETMLFVHRLFIDGHVRYTTVMEETDNGEYEKDIRYFEPSTTRGKNAVPYLNWGLVLLTIASVYITLMQNHKAHEAWKKNPNL